MTPGNGAWYTERIPVGFAVHILAIVLLAYVPIPLFFLATTLVWKEIGRLILCGHGRNHVWLSRGIALVGCIFSAMDFYLQSQAVSLLWPSTFRRTIATFVAMFIMGVSWKDIGSVVFFLLTNTATTQVFLLAPLQAFMTQIGIVAASDAFQYFVGKRFGSYRPVPTISPNKTIEGYVGGLILCNVLGMVFAESPFSLHYLVWFNGLIICGMLGDLAISSWKRFHLLKDTGSILSSHGGLLDRLYSHVAGFLWTVCFLHLTGRSDTLAKNYARVDYFRVHVITCCVWAIIWIQFIWSRTQKPFK